MTAFNVFLKEVTLNEWTVEGGGTALEAIGKTAIQPAEPSTAKLLKVAAASKKLEALLDLTSGDGLALKEALVGGAKVIGATVWFFGKSGGTISLNFGVTGPFAEQRKGTPTAKGWYSFPLAKLHAEELTTVAKLEALKLLLESASATANTGYEIYLSVETEPGGGTVQNLAGSTSVHFAATSAITASAVIVGSAQVRLAGTGALAAQANLAGKTSVRLSAKAQITSVAGLAGATTFHIGASSSISANSVLLLSGSTQVRVSAVSRIIGTAALAGQATVKVKASGRITSTQPHTTLRVYAAVKPPQKLGVTVKGPQPLPLTVQVESI